VNCLLHYLDLEPTSAGARTSACPQHQRQSFPDKQASRLELQRGPAWRTSIFGATFGQRRRLTPRTPHQPTDVAIIRAKAWQHMPAIHRRSRAVGSSSPTAHC